MSRNPQDNVTRCRDNNAATLQQYANDKRITDQFNDITVLAGSESIPANKLVLSCYSKFFESMFLSPMKERYQSEVEIKQFDGKAVRALIDFMYCGEIIINVGNVLNLLAVADFLQMDDVTLFCFEFLEDNLNIDNCLEIIKLSTQYNFSSSLKMVYSFVADNFDQVVQTDTFKNLSKPNLISLISELNSSVVKQSSVYNAILSWTHQNESRKVDFTELFLNLDLTSLSIDFLEKEVSKEPLVKQNVDCLKAVLSSVFAKLKGNHAGSKCMKILCVNGCDSRSVFEVYSISGDISNAYPPVPNQPQHHRLLKLNNFVYCIGGWSREGYNATNKIFRLNLTESNLNWSEMASMLEPRNYFGAAVYNGCLVVNGNESNSKTTEAYDVELNCWRNIASTNQSRSYHELVAVNGALFAIGGCANGKNLSSMERLDDLNRHWRIVQSMKTPRHLFAAVAYNGFIYVIGGYSTIFEKSVEKYDPINNLWTVVNSMRVGRYLHAACFFHGKIYVFGGVNDENISLKKIECYDPELDQWTIVGETEYKCCNHAVVVL